MTTAVVDLRAAMSRFASGVTVVLPEQHASMALAFARPGTPAGDHDIVLGRVVATEAAAEERRPLLCYRRRLGGPEAL